MFRLYSLLLLRSSFLFQVTSADSWAALIIRAIEGDHVLVDMSDIWIPILELRRSS